MAHTNRIKQEIITGMAGVFLTIFAWRLLSPVIVAAVPPAFLQAVNIAMVWSMVLLPLILLLRSNPVWADYGITGAHLPRQIGVGIGIGLGMGTVLTLLPMVLGLKQLVYTGSGFASPGQALGRLAYFLLVIGFVEEFIFRGFLYGKLKQVCLGNGTAILISSALFGVYHFTGLNFTQVLTTGLIGAFFCICREKVPGCTLLSLVIAHGLHDWLIRFLAAFF